MISPLKRILVPYYMRGLVIYKAFWRFWCPQKEEEKKIDNMKWHSNIHNLEIMLRATIADA